MFQYITKKLIKKKYFALAKKVNVADLSKTPPDVHIGLKNFNIRVNVQKTFEQKIDNFLDLEP
jgi:hypothetical protein